MRVPLRWAIALAAAAASIVLTVLFWPHGAFFFLFLPFLWRPRARSVRACASCGWATEDATARFCPRDATPLP
jgi:hypothetical protein